MEYLNQKTLMETFKSYNDSMNQIQLA